MPSFSYSNPRNKICPAIALLMLFIMIIQILCLGNLAEANVAKPLPTQFSKFSRQSMTPSVFEGTACKEACESVLSSLKTDKNELPKTPKELFDHSVQFSMNQARWALDLASNLTLSLHRAPQTSPLDGGIDNRMELLGDSLDQLYNVISRKNNPTHTYYDVQTWLSAALTNQETCMESPQSNKFQVEKGKMDFFAQNLSQLISNSLSPCMSNIYKPSTGSSSTNSGRKLLSGEKFPSWLSGSDRKLLEAMAELEPGTVVAQDGSGTHKTGEEAIGLASSLAGGGVRSVIHVEPGRIGGPIPSPAA